MTEDLIEIYDVTFTKSAVEPGKVYAMHNDIYKAFKYKDDPWTHPQIAFDAETTQQAKAQYVLMRESGELEVVDDNFAGA